MAAPLGEQTIVFFDGLCHLCNGFVDFAIRQDRRKRLLFAPLQGETARRLLSDSDRQALDTVIVVETGRAWRESSAVLHVFQRLGGVWSLFARIARLIPVGLRDRVYRWVARYRLAWFGERQTCRLPTPAERGRLLE